MKNVTILGATGSIGLSTLDVIARHPDKYRVFALTANTQIERLFELCQIHRPEFAVMVDDDAAEKLRSALQSAELATKVLSGADGLEQVASESVVDYVMAAIVGAAGLPPTLAAAQAGKRVLLANKEALVMSGKLFMDEVKNNGAVLLPIDSEHNAIFQCMPEFNGKNLRENGIESILLTASGGPFRTTPLEKLTSITPEQACAHPNWSMGKKISVDSATMMNKGLEIIEACWLFGVTVDEIEVVIHPQSIIHSMVRYSDGSVLAQLGNPDMRTPIAHALAWPDRIDSGVEPLDFTVVKSLEFEPPDLARFPCLRLAIEAARQGGTASTILNAANEVAVDAFLNRGLGYTEIPRIIESTLEQSTIFEPESLDAIVEVDLVAREAARRNLTNAGRRVG